MYMLGQSITNTSATTDSLREIGRSSSALASAILVTACFVWSSSHTPLPHLFGAAAFLFVASFTDVRWKRIPNVLTLSALALVLAHAFASEGWSEGFEALAGAGLALVLFGAAFVLGWMGAGDVKATMVLGALWGPIAFAVSAWWMIVMGGCLAIVLLGFHRGALRDLVRRWSLSLRYTIQLGRLTYLPPAPTRAAAGLPFAVAMGLGAACAQIWGSPWK